VKRTIAVVSAGLGRPSSTRLLADRLTVAVEDAVRRAGELPVSSLVELRGHGHDLLDHLFTGYPSAELERVLDLVGRADGLIVVTPVYAASFSGLFKLFVDVLDDKALTGKPVLLGATGGTARHSLVLEHAMRPVFTHLRAVVVPASVFAAPEDWGAASTGERLVERVTRAAEQFADEITRRSAPVVHDPLSLPASFDLMLAEAAGHESPASQGGPDQR
jgi:FMN reductase